MLFEVDIGIVLELFAERCCIWPHVIWNLSHLFLGQGLGSVYLVLNIKLKKRLSGSPVRRLDHFLDLSKLDMLLAFFVLHLLHLRHELLLSLPPLFLFFLLGFQLVEISGDSCFKILPLLLVVFDEGRIIALVSIHSNSRLEI